MRKSALFSRRLLLFLCLLLFILSACERYEGASILGQQSNEVAANEGIEKLYFAQPHLTLAPGNIYSISVFADTNKEKRVNVTQMPELSLVSSDSGQITVLGDREIQVNGDVPTGTTAVLTARLEDIETTVELAIKAHLEDTVVVQGDKMVVTNSEDRVVVVNKQRSLPEKHVPSDLVVPNVPFTFDGINDKRKLRKEAAAALEELFALAKQEGIILHAVSGYRSYDRQDEIYKNNVASRGEKAASRVSAQAGHSEHQTGLAMDVSSSSVNYQLSEAFGNSPEGKWLAANAHRAGFIIRYMQGKEDITGYVYEPWHLRYVGKAVAEEVFSQDVTLEEYFGDVVKVIQQ